MSEFQTNIVRKFSELPGNPSNEASAFVLKVFNLTK